MAITKIRAWTEFDSGSTEFEVIADANQYTHEQAARICAEHNCADDKLQVGVLVQQPAVQTVFTQYISDDGEVHVTHEHEVTTKIQTDVKCLRPEPNPCVIDEC